MREGTENTGGQNTREELKSKTTHMRVKFENKTGNKNKKTGILTVRWGVEHGKSIDKDDSSSVQPIGIFWPDNDS